jgi:hypothetical protein
MPCARTVVRRRPGGMNRANCAGKITFRRAHATSRCGRFNEALASLLTNSTCPAQFGDHKRARDAGVEGYQLRLMSARELVQVRISGAGS